VAAYEAAKKSRILLANPEVQKTNASSTPQKLSDLRIKKQLTPKIYA